MWNSFIFFIFLYVYTFKFSLSNSHLNSNLQTKQTKPVLCLLLLAASPLEQVVLNTSTLGHEIFVSFRHLNLLRNVPSTSSQLLHNFELKKDVVVGWFHLQTIQTDCREENAETTLFLFPKIPLKIPCTGFGSVKMHEFLHTFHNFFTKKKRAFSFRLDSLLSTLFSSSTQYIYFVNLIMVFHIPQHFI